MFEIIVLILFGWVFFKLIGLTFKVAWGITKVIAVILSVLALPLLIVCMVFASGVFLLLPILLLVGAFALLKATV